MQSEPRATNSLVHWGQSVRDHRTLRPPGALNPGGSLLRAKRGVCAPPHYPLTPRKGARGTAGQRFFCKPGAGARTYPPNPPNTPAPPTLLSLSDARAVHTRRTSCRPHAYNCPVTPAPHTQGGAHAARPTPHTSPARHLADDESTHQPRPPTAKHLITCWRSLQRPLGAISSPPKARHSAA